MDHTRRAKKRALKILHAKSNRHRRKPYRDLLWVARRSVGYAKDAVLRFESLTEAGIIDAVEVHRALRERAYLAEQVISQTERRVFDEERVLGSDKVVSIFEPHTDIIVKGRRDTCYGHKVTLAGGASGRVSKA